jgi:hypothetical protein
VAPDFAHLLSILPCFSFLSCQMGLGWEQRGETLVLGTDLVTE